LGGLDGCGQSGGPCTHNDDIRGLVPALRNFCGFCSHRADSGQGGRPNSADADSRRLDEISSREVRFRFFLHWSVLTLAADQPLPFVGKEGRFHPEPVKDHLVRQGQVRRPTW